MKYKVELTETQARIILGLIDCFTDEHEQDYTLDKNGFVTGTCDMKKHDLQTHLNTFLDKKRLDY